MTALIDRLPSNGADPDALLDAFFAYASDLNLTLYPAQEEAILEILAGSNVIVNTPTGSGKSLVAVAAHFAALASGRRSFYTAPIKALVSEKFFALCRDFGTDNVGMVTGDGSVNPDAPIICCTAEILANRALRDGADADADVVVIDEFHYYSEPQRGWAWQVPLLELNRAQFVLMSATLGKTDFFLTELTERTGRPTELVTSATRPVPLTFEYRETTLLESIETLLETDRAPVYKVFFTQREATEAAQSLMSINVLTKDEKGAVKELIGGFRFDTPIGKDLKRWLAHGIGVHHAGLLPKYRLLVEKLAQAGLLKVICGTDTLGVGVNVPIRTVLFTQLCKYDGRSVRVLRVREFQQIAGRAGRRGYDDVGYVWAQAPAHEVENAKAAAKAEGDPKKKKKLVKKKPPERGYVHWSEDTFNKLINGDPEALDSSFAVSHQMLMNVLDRPADSNGNDGLDAAKRLLTTNHEPRKRQRAHIRRAISLYRSLVDSGVVTRLDTRDDLGRRVRVNYDLQQEFALNQPLSLFAVEALGALDPEEDDHALSVLSVIESVLETPRVIVAAQMDRLRTELISELKARGVEYEERMEKLEELRPPAPLADFLEPALEIFSADNPWVRTDLLAPKSIARDLWEQAMTFSEFVTHYGLKRSEGVVLRYLTDAWRGMLQTVPVDLQTDEVLDLTEWLSEMIRQVDSSLIDEWEQMTNPVEDADDGTPAAPPEPRDITQNNRAFTVMVRNSAFRWVLDAARNFNGSAGDNHADTDALRSQLDRYWEEHDEIITNGDARHTTWFSWDRKTATVEQIIIDPEGTGEWRLIGTVDLAASAEAGTAITTLEEIIRR